MKIANQTENLQNGATATNTGTAVQLQDRRPKRTFQASIVGSGSVSATVPILVSNDGSNFLTLGTISLSGTTSATDGFASDAPWAFVRADVTAISGTSATVNVVMGC
jgi:hypothetical protein